MLDIKCDVSTPNWIMVTMPDLPGLDEITLCDTHKRGVPLLLPGKAIMQLAFIPHVPLRFPKSEFPNGSRKRVRVGRLSFVVMKKTKPPAEDVRFGEGKKDAVEPLEFLDDGDVEIETKFQHEPNVLEKKEKLMNIPVSKAPPLVEKVEVSDNVEPKIEFQDAGESASAQNEPIADKVGGPEVSKSEQKSGVKMDAEAIARAQKKRNEEKANEAELKAKNDARNLKILQNVEKVWRAVGEKTGAFEFGAKTRVNFETALDEAQTAAAVDSSKNAKELPEGVEKPKASEEQQAKIKGKAATAFREITTTLGEKWNGAVVPAVKKPLTEKLPKEYENIGSRAINTGIISALFGLLLLPLFIGGSSPDKSKVIPSKETDALEKKLAAKKSKSAPESSSSTAKSPFPRESPAPVATAPTLTPLPPPPPPVVPPPKPAIVEKPAPSIPKTPEVVTEVTMLSAIKSSTGVNSKLILGSSFDSLAVRPTVILEVSRGFQYLGEKDQRAFASSALESARSLGYESVSVVETGTDFEFVRAGVDIVLGDETANLRAQLGAVQRKADELAVRDAEAEASLDAMKQRMDEERVASAIQKKELLSQLNTLRSETETELNSLRAELADIPDREVLEKRAEEAEQDNEKLQETVEVLGRQLTVARDSEQTAKATAEEKVAETDRVTAEAERKVSNAIEEAERNAASTVAEIKASADESVAAATKKLSALEDASAKAQADAEKNYAELKATSDRTLSETIAADEAKTKSAVAESEKSVRELYEAKLDDLKNEMKANLDRYNAEAKAAAKELGESQKKLDEAGKKYNEFKLSSEKTLSDTIAAQDSRINKKVTESEKLIQSKYENVIREQQASAKIEQDRLKTEMKASVKELNEAQKKLEDASKSYDELKAQSERALADAVTAKENAVKGASAEAEKSVTNRFEAVLREQKATAKTELDRVSQEAKTAAKAADEAERKAAKELAAKDKEVVALSKKVDALQTKLDAAKRKTQVQEVSLPPEESISGEK